MAEKYRNILDELVNNKEPFKLMRTSIIPLNTSPKSTSISNVFLANEGDENQGFGLVLESVENEKSGVLKLIQVC